MKKAISPLISWVLLVGLVIAIGSFVYFWAINYARMVDPTKGNLEEMYCDSVRISITDSCRLNDNTLRIDLLNKGSFKIVVLTLSRETGRNPMSSCLELLDPGISDPGILPGGTYRYNFDVSQSLIPLNGVTLDACPTADSVQVVALPNLFVDSVSITPWIKIKENQIAFNDKKISINPDNLNKPCSAQTP